MILDSDSDGHKYGGAFSINIECKGSLLLRHPWALGLEVCFGCVYMSKKAGTASCSGSITAVLPTSTRVHSALIND